MSTVSVKRTSGGGDAGTVELADAVFGIEPNIPVMHQVVTAQLAHRRAGTHSTKTRAEVAGGGAKPWRQKGTGRARQGSIRSPQWRGGGIAHGPKPRDHSKKVNKKVVALALRSALSDRAADGKVLVVDGWGIDAPKTKDGVRVLEALGLRAKGERAPRALLVLFRSEDAAWKSFRNLGERVQVILPEELNAYDVLVNDYIVFSRATLDAVTSRFTGEAAAIGEAVVDSDDDDVPVPDVEAAADGAAGAQQGETTLRVADDDRDDDTSEEESDDGA